MERSHRRMMKPENRMQERGCFIPWISVHTRTAHSFRVKVASEAPPEYSVRL